MPKRKKTYEQRMVDYNRERAGKAAQGFVLGGLAGNIPGALFGSWYAQKDVKRPRQDSGVSFQEPKKVKLGNFTGEVVQTKKMPKSTQKSAQKKLVQRSSMVVSGKTKTKKIKKVKVPTKLRKQVKQILSGTMARGTYTTVKQGFVGTLLAAGGGSLAGDDLGKSQTAILIPSTTGLPGRTLFNQLVNFSPGVASTVVAGTGLNFFTPAKIWDAASVLFNRKAPSTGPYNYTNNLSTLATLATGAAAQSPGKLMINVLASSVKFTMKNTSNRVVTVEIWECMPTLKFQESNPVATLQSIVPAYSGATSDTNLDYYVGPSATLSNTLVHDPTVDPLALSKNYFGYKFAWKKRSMVLAPDETCIHEIRGPRSVLDCSKMVSVNNAAPTPAPVEIWNALVKGYSVGCVVSVNGDQVMPTAASTGGRKTWSTTAVALAAPVAVEVMESYTLSVPEVAGFIQTDGIAGTIQQLNLRKHKRVLWNACELGHVAYTLSNEVNPAAEVAFAQTS